MDSDLLPEEMISSQDVNVRLDGLIRAYEEIVRDSVFMELDRLNYLSREALVELKQHRREVKKYGLKMLETLFNAFDERLFRLGLEFYEPSLVEPFYLPKAD